jgi:F0F1-type ATP synthase membrane subunit c/vacuolar-type H+-ATPase subunit K
MSANVVRYRSAAWIPSVIALQPSRVRTNCEPVSCAGSLAALVLRRPRRLGRSAMLLGAGLSLALGCIASGTPQPRAAVDELAAAVARKDAHAVHAMLDEQSRRNVTEQELSILLQRDGAEIAKLLARHTSQFDPTVRATVVLPGGEQVVTAQASGEYFVDDTSGLLAVAVTPREALTALRRALEQPDYQLLLQLLSSDVREAVESQRKSLVQALSDVEVLDVVVQGDRAVVNTADGHRVELELESGVWRVRDFD